MRHISSGARRVCFVSARRGIVVNDKLVRMDWANGRLISVLSKSLPFLSLACFSDAEKELYVLSVNVNKVYRFPLPFAYMASIYNLWFFFKVLRKIEKENDLLIVQLPTIAFIPLLLIRKPCIFHVCANVLTASRNPFKYSWLKSVPASLFSFLMHRVFIRLFRRKNNLLIVNGSELGALYGAYNPRVVISSSLFQSEIINIHQLAPRKGPFNVLFIGRPSLEKGFPTLLTSFYKFITSGREATLQLVGFSEEEFKKISPDEYRFSRKFSDKLKFHGFVSWGDTYSKIVRSCHVMLFCSVSEGTPRVLIESRGLGCPVIATKVGGVVDSIQDGIDGFLVPPQDAEGMVEVMKKLYDNEEIRMEVARNGISRVNTLTVENFSKVFRDLVMNYK